MQNGVNTPHLCDHDAYFRGHRLVLWENG
ncbi:hypothetical protein OIU78_022562, partial [Salix suchowensis]